VNAFISQQQNEETSRLVSELMLDLKAAIFPETMAAQCLATLELADIKKKMRRVDLSRTELDDLYKRHRTLVERVGRK
jgi:hypothetical protein